MSYSIIIPSKNADNLRACVEGIHGNQPAGADLIVVDDGLDLDFASDDYRSGGFIDGSKILGGEKPFCWARNINAGIKAAGSGDVILLNDDAILQTPSGFDALVEAGQNKSFGVTAAAVKGMVGCQEQNIGYQWFDGRSLRRVKHHMMCFVAVHIRRDVLDSVGLLDERYTDYGYDDDDYCERVRQAGLKLAVFDGCVVEHGSLKSTFRGRPGTSLLPNRNRFVEKWGFEPGKGQRTA